MRNPKFAGPRAALGLSALSLAVMLALVPAGAQALGLTGAAPARTAFPADPRTVDLGLSSPTASRSVTVTLALRNQAALESYVASLGDSKSANFRKFLTPAQFTATYGQTPAAVAQVVAALTAQGLTVNRVHPNNLLITVTGTNAQLAATFGVALHDYSLLGQTYTAPTTAITLPAPLKGIVTGVSGISTRAALHSYAAQVPHGGALAGDLAPLKRPATAGALPTGPGTNTVLDLAAKYNVNPLYAKNLTGAGRTIGIATLAGYSQSDVFAYWNALGLTTDPNRITDIPVDGGYSAGYGPGSGGAGETTLDVEQAGGVAPGAAIRVYIAPVQGNGFLDVFSTAINENLVDVLSVSWGSAEVFNSDAETSAFHALFLQAASFGIPVIAASGDSGAFDINQALPYPDCTTLLTVDFPAADPLVLAAGGTTLPYSVQYPRGAITVPSERAWGWDYLRDYVVNNYGTDVYYSDFYLVGGGGGVSLTYPQPAYQAALSGVQTTAAGQSLICTRQFWTGSGSGYVYVSGLPSGVAGRNVPDVSLNADPFSGYLLYVNGGWDSAGGTSFVSPQLNGILTLVSSGLGGRIGPINPQLYATFAKQGYGANSAFTPITAGDNEYWKSTASYNPATGLGSLNVQALATALGVK